MEIGTEKPAIIVEPLEDPFKIDQPEKAPERAPEPVKRPEKAPEKTPAKT
jgi:hypothetical protein